MITPEILRPIVGGDLARRIDILSISDSTVEIRAGWRIDLDLARQRIKRAGFHVYGIPSSGPFHRLRVGQRANE